MRKTQVMTNVLLPQALRAMLPTIISQLVVVLKDTALGFLILYPELLYQARFLGSQGQLGSPILQVALVIAVIYIAMCLLLSAARELPGAAHPAQPQGRRAAPRRGGGRGADGVGPGAGAGGPDRAAAPARLPEGLTPGQRFSIATGSMPSAVGSSKPSTWA